MTWQAYVDDNLVGTGKVSKAAIFGVDGNLWASSTHFMASEAEIHKLIAAFDDASDVQANGLYLEGRKYVYLRSDSERIYARLGALGVTCIKTNQAVLVALYNESMQAGESTVVVEALGDYLRSSGYIVPACLLTLIVMGMDAMVPAGYFQQSIHNQNSKQK
ncbi:profilin, required for normal timing of actin polymerization in response to thermal stress [Mortierella claussenii]|nr:profilin, required for normal timing of actin polymerization in response to thermal stress [Mortierella claussenii]